MKKLSITLIAISITISIIVFLMSIAAILYIFSAITNNQPPTGVSAASSQTVISLPVATDIEAGINQYRATMGLAALDSNVASLDEAAAERADQMCRDNDWSHKQDWAILTPHYTYAFAGENLYYGFLQKDQAAAAVKAWIASPTHQQNMVADYSQMGVAVKSCPGFQGEPTAVIVTNYFGVPR